MLSPSLLLSCCAWKSGHHHSILQISNSQQWRCSAGFVCMTKSCVCRFCERIIPVQITCSMIQQALTSATQRLAKLHAKQAVEASEDQLVNFAGQSIIFLPPISVCTCNQLVLHMCRCLAGISAVMQKRVNCEKVLYNQRDHLTPLWLEASGCIADLQMPPMESRLR